MRNAFIIAGLIALPQAACAQGNPADGGEGEPAAAAPSDEEIFKAAGFVHSDGAWRKCGDPGTGSYEGGAIMQRGDFNGDGLPDAVVTEGGTYCFGMTGYGYTLVSQQAGGGWRVMDERIGLPEFLGTIGAEGWPDIEVGGPGFCFPVLRWNGKDYAVNRSEYEGKPCPR